jgi:hypothetical protein
LVYGYVPEGAAGKTVLKDELKKIVWGDSMKPFTLKDKFNRLELIYTYCGEVLDETDKIKQITQSITHKSLYASAISTARTRALPNAVTLDHIIDVMQEIYNNLRCSCQKHYIFNEFSIMKWNTAQNEILKCLDKMTFH